MGNKEKKQKRKDKKRRQRTREKKGVLPSSVQALLGYLGGGGPGPTAQGDIKPRERAGVDSFDTLHQIIKSQQMMSAGYMANLEKIAYKTELSEQLKKQGEENKRQIDDTLKQTTQISKVSQKIGKVGSQILWHMNLKNPTASQQENLLVLQEKLQKYEGQFEFADKINSYQNPTLAQPDPQARIPTASSIAPSRAGRSSSVPRGGGADVSNTMWIAQAPVGNPILPYIDPRQGMSLGGGGALKAPSKTQEVQAGLSEFQYSDDTASSLLLDREFEEVQQMQKQLYSSIGRATRAGATTATEAKVVAKKGGGGKAR